MQTDQYLSETVTTVTHNVARSSHRFRCGSQICGYVDVVISFIMIIDFIVKKGSELVFIQPELPWIVNKTADDVTDEW